MLKIIIDNTGHIVKDFRVDEVDMMRKREITGPPCRNLQLGDGPGYKGQWVIYSRINNGRTWRAIFQGGRVFLEASKK